MVFLCIYCMCLKCVRGLIIDNTFHCTRTEVVVVGFTARITGGSSGTGQKRNRKTDWGRKQTNTDKQTYFFTPLQSTYIMFSNPNIFASFVIVSSLLPSCRVVTASVSLLRTLSPTSLVASILSLYDVKGFSLQKYTQKHMYRFFFLFLLYHKYIQKRCVNFTRYKQYNEAKWRNSTVLFCKKTFHHFNENNHVDICNRTYISLTEQMLCGSLHMLILIRTVTY